MGCTRAETPMPTPAPVQIRVTSDAAALPLMRALTDAYAAAQPNTNFVLEWGNAPAVMEAMRLGRAQLGIVSVLPSTINQGTDNRNKLWFTDLATDSLVVIVNAQNKLNNLSTFELREIYAGSRSRWRDVDPAMGDDIDLGAREVNDPTRVLFESVVMNKLAPSPNAIVLPSIDIMVSFVALQPAAIGYVPASRVFNEPRVKIVRIDDTLPNPETLNNGKYPMPIPIYVVANSEPQDEVRKFAAWAIGPNGQAVATKLGYSPIK